ncbi:MAG TPA: ABC transporter ATP-binding protein [Trebonia sp.]|jgi:branched-chain amino acid transport system ATP-binding protein|nr:ABC transporter ATP-binding protein [Trebonia sp.]
MTSLLEISNLTAGYGKAKVLRDVSLTVARGESVAMIGRNGAGKSTLLLSLFGLAQVHAGRVTVAGQLMETSRRTRLAAHGLALTPQGRRIITQLTVEENLVLGTAAGRIGHWNLDAVYQLFPVLADRAKKPGSALSGGQQQMLAIGRALMANPELLFLDEPSEGLAPVIIDGLVDVFRAIQSAGTGIFIVEQHLNLVRKVADRVLVLSKGELTAEAPISELDSPEFQQAIAL